MIFQENPILLAYTINIFLCMMKWKHGICICILIYILYFMIYLQLELFKAYKFSNKIVFCAHEVNIFYMWSTFWENGNMKNVQKTNHKPFLRYAEIIMQLNRMRISYLRIIQQEHGRLLMGNFVIFNIIQKHVNGCLCWLQKFINPQEDKLKWLLWMHYL